MPGSAEEQEDSDPSPGAGGEEPVDTDESVEDEAQEKADRSLAEWLADEEYWERLDREIAAERAAGKEIVFRFAAYGFGTLYRGRMGARARSGKCPKCGEEADLQTFDTKCYLVFFGLRIPFPVGDRRIRNLCPLCGAYEDLKSNHYIRWRDDEIDECLDVLRQNPESEEAAVGLLKRMLFFRMREESEDLAAQLDARYPDSCFVQTELAIFWAEAGAVLFGSNEKPLPHWQKAHAADPDAVLPRRGLAEFALRKDAVEQAETLLAPMEDDPDAWDESDLHSLAFAYERRGDARGEYSAYERMCRWFPSVAARDRDARGRVRILEAELGRSETILPPPEDVVDDPEKKGDGCCSIPFFVLLFLGIGYLVAMYYGKDDIIRGWFAQLIESEPVRKALDWMEERIGP